VARLGLQLLSHLVVVVGVLAPGTANAQRFVALPSASLRYHSAVGFEGGLAETVFDTDCSLLLTADCVLGIEGWRANAGLGAFGVALKASYVRLWDTRLDGEGQEDAGDRLGLEVECGFGEPPIQLDVVVGYYPSITPRRNGPEVSVGLGFRVFLFR